MIAQLRSNLTLLNEIALELELPNENIDQGLTVEALPGTTSSTYLPIFGIIFFLVIFTWYMVKRSLQEIKAKETTYSKNNEEIVDKPSSFWTFLALIVSFSLFGTLLYLSFQYQKNISNEKKESESTNKAEDNTAKTNDSNNFSIFLVKVKIMLKTALFLMIYKKNTKGSLIL